MPFTKLFQDLLLVLHDEGEAFVHLEDGSSVKVETGERTRTDWHPSFDIFSSLKCNLEAQVHDLPPATGSSIAEYFGADQPETVAVLAQSTYNNKPCLEVGKVLQVTPMTPFDTKHFEVGLITGFTLP
ncbi:MAG: hypothetical protein JWO54_66 [Candidatus Saccharibacteria bacterium]|nr:hypothetical protein [Candidatus Saccharibacteria bacterium]MDB5180308.1 hypothetical protein [Candidatus Saccharibacteria bacterium]